MMATVPTINSAALFRKFEDLTRRWRELCALYLPVAPKESMWRYSRPSRPGDLQEGWKLHISATVLNAHHVLEKVGPLLVSKGIKFKAPASLVELRRINSGVHYAYSQVGKVFTVYPRTDEEAVSIARLVHRETRRMTAPGVPFDLRYGPTSNVYYRYGAFKDIEMKLPDGRRVPAMRDLQGNLVPDLYGFENAQPEWAVNPFPTRSPRVDTAKIDRPLQTRFRVFRALSQRGKGGVYQAVDLTANPPRLYLLKEGRKGGEVGWDGRDGRWRVKHEERVLRILRAHGVDVPQVYSSFELAGNYYMVSEFVDGESLHSFLLKRKRRLSIGRALNYGLQLSTFITQIHAAGWIWRDCKPTNLILTKHGELRSLDFEGACPIDQPDRMPWITPTFAPPAGIGDGVESAVYDDLFALGTILYLLLSGRLPEGCPLPLAIRRSRRNTPLGVCKLISALLDHDARQRLTAREVAAELTNVLSRPQPSRGKRK